MLKVVVDTNVIVSALLKSYSIPALIVSLVLRKSAKLCLSQDIFLEYQGVLARDKFKKLDKEKVGKLLHDLKTQALLVKPIKQVNLIKKDPTDNKFLECALDAKADYLITGDTKHFPMESFHNTKILTPDEFASILISYFFHKNP
jgi:putative PIN family toxin of toxin-antitoxin system